MHSVSPASSKHRFTILIGLRGCGKSTIGPLLARDGECIDLDTYVARSAGVAHAADYILASGIDAFREQEGRVLTSILRLPARKRNVIVSLGGGTPTGSVSHRLLTSPKVRAQSRVVYLHASPIELQRRLRLTDLSHRPSLTGKDPVDEVVVLYTVRDPLYRQLADIIIEVEGRTPEIIASEILAI